MLISVDSSDSCGGYDKALRTGCLLGGVRNAPTGNSRRSAPADQPARGRGVVKGAQHPGHVPQGLVGLTALGQGAQGLALEVQDVPTPLRLAKIGRAHV